MIPDALADNLLVPVAVPALLLRCRPGLCASSPVLRADLAEGKGAEDGWGRSRLCTCRPGCLGEEAALAVTAAGGFYQRQI